MTARLFLFAAWALLGGMLSYALLHLLDLFGLAVVIALVVAGLQLHTVHPYARAEIVGLAAGPGILFVVLGETDDAPGLVLIGGAILAATVAVYFSLRREQSATAA